MALVLADRVQEVTTTTGTGTVTLGGAVTGFQSFAVIGNGNTTYYTIAGQNTTEWEVGIGTYTSSGTTLARTTVLSSSNAGALVNFSAGTKTVFVTQPSERTVYVDSANTSVSVPQLSATSITDSGNLTFTGTGNRITGDFSNATVANRLMFQTSTVNSATSLAAIPNGTGFQTTITAFNNSDPTNAGLTQIFANTGEASFRSSVTGTGSYLPMTFYTGGSERMRVDTSGNVGIGTSLPSNKFDILTANNTGLVVRSVDYSGSFVPSTLGGMAITTNGAYPLIFYINSGERMRIDSSGNVGIGTGAPSKKFVVSNAGANGIETSPDDPTTATNRLLSYNRSTAAYTPFIIQGSDLRLFTTGLGGSESVRIDSSGNVGIGTASPNAKVEVFKDGGPAASGNMNTGLVVAAAAGSYALNIGANASGAYTWLNSAYQNASNTASPMVFMTGATERMRIDTSGNLLMATSGEVQFYSNQYGIRASTGLEIKTGDFTRFLKGTTEYVRIDTSGNLLVTGASGLGYGTGSGGTVTQATNKSTAVTLNKPTGQITMNNAALAAGASIQFQLNNSLLAASDTLVATSSFGAQAGSYLVNVLYVGAGAAVIRVTNVTAGSLSDAVTINFTVIKGATA